MTIEVGKTYQSRNFPHVTRTITRIEKGIVYFTRTDTRTPESAHISKEFNMVESEFEKCSTGEIPGTTLAEAIAEAVALERAQIYRLSKPWHVRGIRTDISAPEDVAATDWRVSGARSFIKVVYPTLQEYLERVQSLATKYLNDAGAWQNLQASDITDEDDRDHFAFIKMALWDKLCSTYGATAVHA